MRSQISTTRADERSEPFRNRAEKPGVGLETILVREAERSAAGLVEGVTKLDHRAFSVE